MTYAGKDSTNKVNAKAPRKLKPGEMLEVYEWPAKELCYYYYYYYYYCYYYYYYY